MDYQTTEQSSSMKMWYIIGIIAIVALGLWYFYGKQPATSTSPTAAEQTTSGLSSGNTTADISADLSQTADVSAELNADAAASAAAVSGF